MEIFLINDQEKNISILYSSDHGSEFEIRTNYWSL
jgi:hypothetical protein